MDSHIVTWKLQLMCNMIGKLSQDHCARRLWIVYHKPCTEHSDILQSLLMHWRYVFPALTHRYERQSIACSWWRNIMCLSWVECFYCGHFCAVCNKVMYWTMITYSTGWQYDDEEKFLRSYNKTSNIRCAKSQNLNDSHLVLKLSLLSDQQVGCLLRCKLYKRFDSRYHFSHACFTIFGLHDALCNQLWRHWQNLRWSFLSSFIG